MNENFVDNSSDIGYNEDNNDEHEVVIDLSVAEPLNDQECTHTTLIAEPDDTIGDAVYHGCANPQCGRGWYIRPNA